MLTRQRKVRILALLADMFALPQYDLFLDSAEVALRLPCCLAVYAALFHQPCIAASRMQLAHTMYAPFAPGLASRRTCGPSDVDALGSRQVD